MIGKNRPKISVLMGVLYRDENLFLLRRSVDSILRQSFRDFELLICAEGSGKAAMTLLKKYALEDQRVRLVHFGKKTDLAAKLNACLREARGEYIARMDDDDRSMPQRFERQVGVLESRKDIAIVGGNMFMRKKGKRCEKMIYPRYLEIKDFYITQPFAHPVLMFRRQLFDRIGGYSEDKWQLRCEDYDLLMRFYGAGYRGMNLQEYLMEFSAASVIRKKRTMGDRFNESITRLQRFRSLHLLPAAAPYVLKPVLTGLLPEKALNIVKGVRKG